MDRSSRRRRRSRSSRSSQQPCKKQKLSPTATKNILHPTPLKSKSSSPRKQRNAGITPSSNRSSANSNSSTKMKHKSCSASPIPSPSLPPITKQDIKPWSIGQRIMVSVDNEDSNTSNLHNRNRRRSTRRLKPIPRHSQNDDIFKAAVIRSYDPDSRLTHIWFETKDNNFEDVDLLSLDWTLPPNSKPLQHTLSFVPDNEWVPVYWKMGQRVLVTFDGKYGNGQDFVAFIDGFDAVSRRHRVNYGDTHEWLWATRDRVKVFKGRKLADYLEDALKERKANKFVVRAPPWQPEIYGLDESFEVHSKQIEENRKGVKPRNTAANEVMSSAEKKKKKKLSVSSKADLEEKVSGDETENRKTNINPKQEADQANTDQDVEEQSQIKASVKKEESKKKKRSVIRIKRSMLKRASLSSSNSASKSPAKQEDDETKRKFQIFANKSPPRRKLQSEDHDQPTVNPLIQKSKKFPSDEALTETMKETNLNEDASTLSTNTEPTVGHLDIDVSENIDDDWCNISLPFQSTSPFHTEHAEDQKVHDHNDDMTEASLYSNAADIPSTTNATQSQTNIALNATQTLSQSAALSAFPFTAEQPNKQEAAEQSTTHNAQIAASSEPLWPHKTECDINTNQRNTEPVQIQPVGDDAQILASSTQSVTDEHAPEKTESVVCPDGFLQLEANTDALSLGDPNAADTLTEHDSHTSMPSEPANVSMEEETDTAQGAETKAETATVAEKPDARNIVIEPTPTKPVSDLNASDPPQTILVEETSNDMIDPAMHSLEHSPEKVQVEQIEAIRSTVEEMQDAASDNDNECEHNQHMEDTADAIKNAALVQAAMNIASPPHNQHTMDSAGRVVSETQEECAANNAALEQTETDECIQMASPQQYSEQAMDPPDKVRSETEACAADNAVGPVLETAALPIAHEPASIVNINAIADNVANAPQVAAEEAALEVADSSSIIEIAEQEDICPTDLENKSIPEHTQSDVHIANPEETSRSPEIPISPSSPTPNRSMSDAQQCATESNAMQPQTLPNNETPASPSPPPAQIESSPDRLISNTQECVSGSNATQPTTDTNSETPGVTLEDTEIRDAISSNSHQADCNKEKAVEVTVSAEMEEEHKPIAEDSTDADDIVQPIFTSDAPQNADSPNPATCTQIISAATKDEDSVHNEMDIDMDVDIDHRTTDSNAPEATMTDQRSIQEDVAPDASTKEIVLYTDIDIDGTAIDDNTPQTPEFDKLPIHEDIALYLSPQQPVIEQDRVNSEMDHDADIDTVMISNDLAENTEPAALPTTTPPTKEFEQSTNINTSNVDTVPDEKQSPHVVNSDTAAPAPPVLQKTDVECNKLKVLSAEINADEDDTKQPVSIPHASTSVDPPQSDKQWSIPDILAIQPTSNIQNTSPQTTETVHSSEQPVPSQKQEASLPPPVMPKQPKIPMISQILGVVDDHLKAVTQGLTADTTVNPPTASFPAVDTTLPRPHTLNEMNIKTQPQPTLQRKRRTSNTSPKRPAPFVISQSASSTTATTKSPSRTFQTTRHIPSSPQKSAADDDFVIIDGTYVKLPTYPHSQTSYTAAGHNDLKLQANIPRGSVPSNASQTEEKGFLKAVQEILSAQNAVTFQSPPHQYNPASVAHSKRMSAQHTPSTMLVDANESDNFHPQSPSFPFSLPQGLVAKQSSPSKSSSTHSQNRPSPNKQQIPSFSIPQTTSNVQSVVPNNKNKHLELLNLLNGPNINFNVNPAQNDHSQSKPTGNDKLKPAATGSSPMPAHKSYSSPSLLKADTLPAGNTDASNAPYAFTNSHAASNLLASASASNLNATKSMSIPSTVNITLAPSANSTFSFNYNFDLSSNNNVIDNHHIQHQLNQILKMAEINQILANAQQQQQQQTQQQPTLTIPTLDSEALHQSLFSNIPQSIISASSAAANTTSAKQKNPKNQNKAAVPCKSTATPSTTTSAAFSRPQLPQKPNKKRLHYPRMAWIRGKKWMRHFSKLDHKYYYLLFNESNEIIGKEWDPWRKHGLLAPWRTKQQDWGEFYDDTYKTFYYHNFKTGDSTYEQPADFEPDPKVEYDSAEEDDAKKT